MRNTWVLQGLALPHLRLIYKESGSCPLSSKFQFLSSPHPNPIHPRVTIRRHTKPYSGPKAVEAQDHQRPGQRKWTMHLWWHIYSLHGSWRSQGNNLGSWHRTLGLNFFLCQGPRPQELEHSILSLGPVVPLLPAPPSSCEVSRICSRKPLLPVPLDFPLKNLRALVPLSHSNCQRCDGGADLFIWIFYPSESVPCFWTTSNHQWTLTLLPCLGYCK